MSIYNPLNSRSTTTSSLSGDFVTVSSDQTITGSKTWTADQDFEGNIIIGGKVLSDLDIEDRLVVLNKGETSAGVSTGSSGIEIDRGTAANASLRLVENALSNNADNRWVLDIGDGSDNSIIYDSMPDDFTVNGKVTVNNDLDVNFDLTVTSLAGAGDIIVTTDSNGKLQNSSFSPASFALSGEKIDGTGTANEVSFFTGTQQISGNSGFTFDGSDVTAPDIIVNSLNASLSGNFLTWDSQKRLVDSGFTGDGRYLATFTNSDLSSGVLTVNHSLGEKYADIVVVNESDRIIQPDNVEFVTNNQLTIDLTSHAPISSTWRILVLAKGSFSSNNTILRQNMYFSADFDNPNNSDWAVNALAPADADSNNAALLIREFDDTTEEGIGFTEYVPDGATQLTITFTARAETSPGSNSNIRYKSYVRQIDPNSSISAWTAGYAHSSIPIGTNENWQVIEETINLSTVGITGDETQVQFEVTRDNSVSNNLAGDAILYSIKVEWS